MHYLFFRVQPQDICLVKFLLESHENLMTVSTIDKQLSKIQVAIAGDFLEDCKTILEGLQKEFLMIPIDEPADISQANY